MGLLLALELIPAKDAVFYILLIVLFEKVAGFIIGKRFEKVN